MQNIEMKMVSIIIPIYQCENVISNTIEDVLKQTYQNFELLLVDDGSSDESIKICKEYEKKDPRIKVILNNHQGVSATRNTGLEHARGEFVSFVDSDDRIETDYLEQLCNHIENNDLVISTFDRWFYDEEKVIKIVKNVQINANIHVKDDLKTFFSALYTSTLLGVVYCKLFRLDVINKYNIRFRTDIYIGEDFLFNFAYLKKCSNIRCIPYMGYHYVCKKGSSLTHKADLKKYEYGKILFQESVKFADEMELSDDDAKGIYNLYLRTIFKNIEIMYQMEQPMSKTEKKAYIKKIVEDKTTIEALEKAKPDTKEFLLYKMILKIKNSCMIESFAKMRLYYKKVIGRS